MMSCAPDCHYMKINSFYLTWVSHMKKESSVPDISIVLLLPRSVFHHIHYLSYPENKWKHSLVWLGVCVTAGFLSLGSEIHSFGEENCSHLQGLWWLHEKINGPSRVTRQQTLHWDPKNCDFKVQLMVIVLLPSSLVELLGQKIRLCYNCTMTFRAALQNAEVWR